MAVDIYGILLSNPEASPYSDYTYFIQKINRTKKTSGDIPNVFSSLLLCNYFFLVSVFTFFIGVFFLAGAFTAGVLTSFFAIGLLRALFIGLTTTLLTDFFSRYSASSNATRAIRLPGSLSSPY